MTYMCVHVHGLNTSDHLPISAILSLKAIQLNDQPTTQPRID